MKYFVTYHNEEKMGPYVQEDPLHILTSKPAQGMLGNYVFIIVGKGKSPKSYELGAMFKATTIASANTTTHETRVEGEGVFVNRYTPLHGFSWFDKLKTITQNFRFGTMEVTDPAIIEGLRTVADRNGFNAS